MSAATRSINTDERPGITKRYPVAAATLLYAGAIWALNASGFLVPASDTAGLRVVGCGREDVDNSTGAAGDLFADVKEGVFLYNNSSTDAVDANDRGKFCFIEDDNTVSETGGTNKVKAGRIVDVETAGVWVDMRAGLSLAVPATFTALAALTSTNGTAAGAADLAALKVETEKSGDDVRAVHATLTDLIAALRTHGILI